MSSYFYFNRGEFQTVRELEKQCFSLAQSAQHPTLLMYAYLMLGCTSFRVGELVSAREHLEQGIAFYVPQKHRPHSSGETQDIKMAVLVYLAWTLWLLGYPDQALKRGYEAVMWAQELSHPFSLAFALTTAASVYVFRREWQAAQEQAEAAITLSTEQGFAGWVSSGVIRRGRALAEQGQAEEGLAQIHHGFSCRAAGEEVQVSNFLTMLAEVHGKMGQAEEGLTVLAEALAMVNKNGERVWEAELYRLKGELLVQSGAPRPESEVQKEAEECFQQAIEVARQQQAKSWELHATMSLARLWQKQGKKEEARQMLAEIYGWFTEGFDTADLKDAKALLDKLS